MTSTGLQIGRQLVMEIRTGEFPKNHLINHGEEFKGGPEELFVYEMSRYMGSCGHAMMENRLLKKGCTYLGF